MVNFYLKTLLGYMLAAVILDVIYYGFLANDLRLLFLINFGVVCTISIILYYTHSFAGGDCKLTVVMTMLYPANYYFMYGKTAVTLFFALCIAILYGYFYLLNSSIYGLIRKKNKFNWKYIKNYLVSFLKSFVAASVYIALINLSNIILKMHEIYINTWIIRIFCMLLAWIIGKNSILKKWKVIVGIFALDLVIGLWIGYIPFSVNPENYILVIILLVCQMTIRTSLYDEVQINDLKKGMILSSFSSMLMQNSRVRGLPKISSEDLKSRLTEEEIASIKKWASPRKITSLTIVRKIPFAVFIFLGFISYFIIWSVVK